MFLMRLLSHSLPESLQHIFATGLDQLRATSTTAVRFASDKLLTPAADHGNE
jgi:hypothetical protein